jgi:hypothetical protein
MPSIWEDKKVSLREATVMFGKPRLFSGTSHRTEEQKVSGSLL